MNEQAEAFPYDRFSHAGGPAAGRAAEPERRPDFVAYALALLTGALLGLLAYFLGLGALLATGHLPPPAFSNTLCVDEKLRFLRGHRVDSPDLLVIGSSIAWRSFDGESVSAPPLNMRPLNGGFCGLPANQSTFVANWLLDRHPGVREVLMLAAPQDFTECSRRPTRVFDVNDVTDYVDRQASPWPYFLKYFSPVSLARNARHIKERRTNHAHEDPLIFDRYGAGPMDWIRPTLYYGPLEPLDDTCFQAVDSLAERVEREGRRLTVVLMPVHPQWKIQEDPDGSNLKAIRVRLGRDLGDTGAVVWDADAHLQPSEAWFTDAIHMRWPAAREFSRELAQQLQRPETRRAIDYPGRTLK